MCQILVIYKKCQQVFESIGTSQQTIYSQDNPKSTSADMELRNYPKPCSYLSFYQYFLHFKLLGQQYYKNESIHLNSSHHSHKKDRECIKTAKNGSFCEELLSENDFEAVLANFCCYDYGANASAAVQKISTRTLELYYTNLFKKLILQLHLRKNIFISLLPACWRYKPGVYVFPDINENE